MTDPRSRTWLERFAAWLEREPPRAATPVPAPPRPAQRRVPTETAEEVRHELARLVAKMGGLPDPGLSSSSWDGCEIEVDRRGYHLVYYERDEPSYITSSPDLDDFLFGLVRKQARARAKHSVAIRNTVDHRRVIFPGSIELLRKVNERWAEREAADVARELAREPFDDMKYQREALVNKLVKQGRSESDAHRLANIQFPRPLR